MAVLLYYVYSDVVSSHSISIFVVVIDQQFVVIFVCPWTRKAVCIVVLFAQYFLLQILQLYKGEEMKVFTNKEILFITA